VSGYISSYNITYVNNITNEAPKILLISDPEDPMGREVPNTALQIRPQNLTPNMTPGQTLQPDPGPSQTLQNPTPNWPKPSVSGISYYKLP